MGASYSGPSRWAPVGVFLPRRRGLPTVLAATVRQYFRTGNVGCPIGSFTRKGDCRDAALLETDALQQERAVFRSYAVRGDNVRGSP